MLILFDQDSVLADFESKFVKRWDEIGACNHVPMEKRTSFSYQTDYPQEFWHIIDQIFAEEGFYTDLAPIPGAIRAAKMLLSEGHDVRICTSPSNYIYCPNEKCRWIIEHMGKDFENRIIITNDKTIVKGDVLIDDKPEITGCCVPEWRHILVDYHYNRHIDRPRITDWNNEGQWRSLIFSGTDLMTEMSL